LLILSVSAYSQLLWRINGKNTRTTSYLLGTNALIPAKALDSITGVYRAFNKCNVVVSAYSSYSVDAESELKRAAVLPFQKSIKDYLADSSYIMVDKELKKTIKFGLKEMALLHPAMIRQIYLAELFGLATNIADDAQTDSYFQRVASVKGVKVIGLQDYSMYIAGLFDPAKIQFYADKLVLDVTLRDSYKSLFVDLLRAYQSDNLVKTSEAAKVIDNLLAFEQTKKPLTENEMVKLSDLLNTNSCFFTIDVQKLAGENGVIEQLRKAGYEVKPYRK